MKKGVYRHYKGNYYLVLGTSTNTETGEESVVYMPLYDNTHTTDFENRPRNMFEEEVSKNVKRFEYVSATY